MSEMSSKAKKLFDEFSYSQTVYHAFLASGINNEYIEKKRKTRDAKRESFEEYVVGLESRIAELEAALTNARELVGMTPPPAFPEWIPVTEKLPEEDCDVLAVISGETSLGRYYKEFHAVCDFIDGLGVIEATHWMPLPQPPEVQE